MSKKARYNDEIDVPSHVEKEDKVVSNDVGEDLFADTVQADVVERNKIENIQTKSHMGIIITLCFIVLFLVSHSASLSASHSASHSASILPEAAGFESIECEALMTLKLIAPSLLVKVFPQ